ncbi:hypothetical protein DSO57_1016301 [Entomophthora muscae]|uniref:Uncharacterized protein n=2 Tax=Entomophthora muscae TaxID=34485 RepID=A0ACC2U2R6_9FUNG|nr:hypothetical protein DSO57_1016299 [Entomophthora muscae]KAJ9081282.1 hypothetical protein DSO57_1016301 [Entomophthora muscae]
MITYSIQQTRNALTYSISNRSTHFTCHTQRKSVLLTTHNNELIVKINPRDYSDDGIIFGRDYFQGNLKYKTANMFDATLVLIANSLHCFTWKKTKTAYLLTNMHNKTLMEFKPDLGSPQTGQITQFARIDKTDLPVFVASLCFILSRNHGSKFKQLLRCISPSKISHCMGDFVSNIFKKTTHPRQTDRQTLSLDGALVICMA